MALNPKIITPPCAYCGKPLSARPKNYYLSRRDPFDDIDEPSLEIGCDYCRYKFEVEQYPGNTLAKAKKRQEPESYAIDKADFQRDPQAALDLLAFAAVHVKDGGQTILVFDQRKSS